MSLFAVHSAKCKGFIGRGTGAAGKISWGRIVKLKSEVEVLEVIFISDGRNLELTVKQSACWKHEDAFTPSPRLLNCNKSEEKQSSYKTIPYVFLSLRKVETFYVFLFESLHFPSN
jgi:hypothetical protein